MFTNDLTSQTSSCDLSFRGEGRMSAGTSVIARTATPASAKLFRVRERVGTPLGPASTKTGAKERA